MDEIEVDRRKFGQLAGGALAAAVCVAGGLTASVPARGPAYTEPRPAVLPPLPDPKSTSLPAAAPADAHAVENVRKLLTWFRGLRDRKSHKVVAGQQIPADAEWGYQQYVQRLADKTGKYPALVGVGFNAEWNPGIPPVLIEHWRNGGLVTMEFHASDPWHPEGGVDSAWVANGQAAKSDLTQLLSGAKPSPARAGWQAQAEQLGDALEELASAGVVVLLRPFFENNGIWFWWGHDLTKPKPTACAELYQDLVGYINETRGLHNVLWVHSPCDSWNAPMMTYYPGSEYIDIVGPTCYNDALLYLGDAPGQRDHSDYADVFAAGKPLGFGECGPSTQTAGNWDARTIIDRIRANYTAMSYFQCWHGWDNTVMQLVDDQHATELMNDPDVLTRDDVDWR